MCPQIGKNADGSINDGFELGISLSNACDFHCAHCLISEHERHWRATGKDIESVVDSINKHKPFVLFFTGGEPVLQINEINKLISHISIPVFPQIRLVTNGSFAKNVASAIKTLRKFKRLDGLQMSYDKYHAKYGPFSNIRNLYRACRELSIDFEVASTIESPIDVIALEKIKTLGNFRLNIQKALPIGNAKKNNIEYKYPEFDPAVFDKRCPNQGKIMYTCGIGFSICCASLVSSEKKEKVAHSTIEKHLASDFYKTISRYSMGELVELFAVPSRTLKPEHSAPCMLCEHVFNYASKT